ncbi:TonB-dependent receptor [Pararcticibacter amylolyticus]|uniref:Outer membrane receptor protein n=1 Tax=Pararcticibacter amylolyticus TaxID=2173175 RepID=A0A2U2PJZ8_9SPHI|nr:TonB-dependent receptor [Pararcticibacter amylolyticus]PWG81582.1 outer membrane receptor protein [Pararcticibacter amylolyticus]
MITYSKFVSKAIAFGLLIILVPLRGRTALISATGRYFTADTIKTRGQTHSGFISGVVTDSLSRKPVEGATVSINELGLFAVTGQSGRFSMKNIPFGNITLSVQSINTLPYSLKLNIDKGKSHTLNIVLIPNSLSLKEVQVVARESNAGKPTSSVISSTAIQHLQATSLADILQLLPGAVTANPDLSGVNKANIRQYSSNNTGGFGTSVIINGSAVSANANMQAVNTSTGGNGASFATAAGGGVDLRLISADNIESVEVVRGIPSVEYGDLSSGSIFVRTKAGQSPLKITGRINPEITQFAAGKGVGSEDKGGSLYSSVDYTRTLADQRSTYTSYDRVTASLQYTRNFKWIRPLYSNTYFNYIMGFDNSKLDPDNMRYQTSSRSRDYSFRLSTEGKWKLGYRLAQSLGYNLLVNYGVQKSYQQELLSGYIYPMSTALNDTVARGTFVPSEYISRVWVEGKPLNISARVNDNFYFRTGSGFHKVLLGAQYSSDANNGKGKTFDPMNPPRILNGNSIRQRTFSSVPSLRQLSFYAEDQFSVRLSQRELVISAGLRYDNVQPSGFLKSDFGTAWSPRLNGSFEIVRNFRLRGGYGITAKAPSLLYLYPENAYFDLLSYNYYTDRPGESLVLINTRVFDTRNSELRITRNHKKEIGFDWSFAGSRRLNVTAYHESTSDGYEFQDRLNILKVPQYSATSFPQGQPPVVDISSPSSYNNYIALMDIPSNGRKIVNRGVEFDLDLGRFDDLRTSFTINGAWLETRSENQNVFYIKYTQAGRDPSKTGIFGSGEGNVKERLVTTARAVHNIPELRFVITLTAQKVWRDRSHDLIQASPIGYIETATGNTVWLTEAERAAITPDDLELYRNINPAMYNTESWTPGWVFNLRLTRELGRSLKFSFYANNVLKNNPLEKNTRYLNEFERRNPSLFFGAEIGFSF